MTPLMKMLPGRTRRALQFPLRTPARTAILESGFTPDRGARVFHPSDLAALCEWGPEAIVASLQTALLLADQCRRALLQLPTLTVAVVVLTDIEGEPLSEDHRELLWRTFGVPVFEQLRTREGVVVARECEVHDGLHVDPTASVASQLSALNAAIVNDPCECGAETPRLRSYLSARLTNGLGTWNVAPTR